MKIQEQQTVNFHVSVLRKVKLRGGVIHLMKDFWVKDLISFPY